MQGRKRWKRGGKNGCWRVSACAVLQDLVTGWSLLPQQEGYRLKSAWSPMASQFLKWSVELPPPPTQDGCHTVWPTYVVWSPLRAKHYVVVQYMAKWLKCPLPPPNPCSPSPTPQPQLSTEFHPRWLPYHVTYICHFTHVHPGTWPESSYKLWSFCTKSSFSKAMVE